MPRQKVNRWSLMNNIKTTLAQPYDWIWKAFIILLAGVLAGLGIWSAQNVCDSETVVLNAEEVQRQKGYEKFVVVMVIAFVAYGTIYTFYRTNCQRTEDSGSDRYHLATEASAQSQTIDSAGTKPGRAHEETQTLSDF